MAPLPLQAQLWTVKLVGSGRERGGGGRKGLGPHTDGFAYSIAVDVDTHQRPIVLPAGRLKVEHTAIGRGRLEVQEPPLPVGGIDQSPLMRSVDVSGTFLQHNLPLVGSIDIARAEHRLPATADTALRNNQVIPAIALEELGTFSHGTLVNRNTIVQQLPSVGRHPMDDDRSGTMATAAKVGLTIVVPEGTGVFPLLNLLDLAEWFPRTGRVGSRSHEQSFIGRTYVYPELTVMVANGRSPGTTGIVAVGVPPGEVHTAVHLTQQSPVDKIIRLQHLHTQPVEIAADHIVFLAYPNDIRVRIVGIQHRILVSTIALVAPVKCLGCSGEAEHGQQQVRNSPFHRYYFFTIKILCTMPSYVWMLRWMVSGLTVGSRMLT